MMNKKRKVSLLLITVLVLSMSFGSVFAAGNFKDLKAWYGSIKVFHNNKQVQLSAQPFIVDGTTYLPLRAVAEDVFGAEVGWDGVNYRIDIKDKQQPADQNVAFLTQQLVEKQTKIVELEAKVKELEAKIKNEDTSSKKTLSEMEKYLNKEYGDFKKAEFDIELSRSKKDMDVEIYIDLEDFSSEWRGMSTSTIKGYLQDIVDDILDSFKDDDVSGFIKDSSTSKNNTLYTFTTNSKGTVSLTAGSGGGSSTNDIDYLENYLNKYHSEYKGVDFEIELYESGKNITVDVYVDGDDWDDLSTSQQKVYLTELYDEIIDELGKVYVEGSVYDDYTDKEMTYFYFSSNGSITLK